ncbi:hypothetical protein [Bradyrhizobium sp. WSM1253]|nr:hypothetical protein [Bradyrhizobium sp. WSM1253]EIG62810.1 hypothetical protein Bra1253DRAFT_07746 [Bradyrhizobium sp. WSM1253]
MMPTPFLMWSRASITGWLMLVMVTFDPVFDSIETELEKRGVEL